MFDKYPRSERYIIVSSSEDGIVDISRLASNVILSKRDTLIPDLVPHNSSRRPNWRRVFSYNEEKLNLHKDIPIVVGGFALHDCVSDFAQEGVRKGYSVFVDEWMTELFKPYYSAKMCGRKIKGPTYYAFDKMDSIMSRRRKRFFTSK